jgi:hypothetical protein
MMTKDSLSTSQRRTLELIQELVFGRIVGLSINNGQPCYDPAPRIAQEIKLGSESECRPDRNQGDLTLKKEFETLFDQLSQLRDGIVDIEIRHSLPFRLVMERRYEELL